MPKRVWFTPAAHVTNLPYDPLGEKGRRFRPEGDWTELSDYIRRRVAAGDGVVTDGPPEGVDEYPSPTPPAEDSKTPAGEELARLAREATERFRNTQR